MDDPNYSNYGKLAGGLVEKILGGIMNISNVVLKKAKRIYEKVGLLTPLD